MFNGKSILVTGGTGSFGRRFCEYILKYYDPARVIVYSRDEYKQAEMRELPQFDKPCMRFFLGDVRDYQRLVRAMTEVDIVVHAAALKQVPAAEYNPHEFIQTNINGAMHVVDAALAAGVRYVLALSTDKAVNPINLYGATKLCSDKIFIAGNSYSGRRSTRFSVVRYGNVIGSRGSVVPYFLKQRATGVITLTDPRMTRFVVTLDQGVEFVVRCLKNMQGGELFVPKIPSCRLVDVAEALAPDCDRRIIGVRPGEKLHEVLIPNDEAYVTLEFDDYFIIKPTLIFWESRLGGDRGKLCSDGFSYASNNNMHWLSVEQLREMCQQFDTCAKV